MAADFLVLQILKFSSFVWKGSKNQSLNQSVEGEVVLPEYSTVLHCPVGDNGEYMQEIPHFPQSLVNVCTKVGQKVYSSPPPVPPNREKEKESDKQDAALLAGFARTV